MLQKTGVPFWPDGAWRDFVVGTILIVVDRVSCHLFSGRRRSISHLIQVSCKPIHALTGICSGILPCWR